MRRTKTEIDKEPGLYLRQIRLKHGIRLRHVADHLSLSEAYICDIEKGNRHLLPSEDALADWCTFIGADIWDLRLIEQTCRVQRIIEDYAPNGVKHQAKAILERLIGQ